MNYALKDLFLLTAYGYNVTATFEVLRPAHVHEDGTLPMFEVAIDEYFTSPEGQALIGKFEDMRTTPELMQLFTAIGECAIDAADQFEQSSYHALIALFEESASAAVAIAGEDDVEFADLLVHSSNKTQENAANFAKLGAPTLAKLHTPKP